MVFARRVWKLLVGIKDGLVLIFMLLFFLALYAALTVRPSAGAIREGALLIELDGAVVEEPSLLSPVEQLLADEDLPREYRTRDIVRALRLAAGDARIRAVVLDLSGFVGGGLVNLREIGEALDEVRAAKKPVLAYAGAYVDDGLLVAAHASEVWVDPLGGAFITGPGGANLYYGRLLDELKVTAHVFRVGTFKSAVEPFIRNDQSPDARKAAEALYGALWGLWSSDVAKARPKADIQRAAMQPAAWFEAYAGDAAKASQGAGLVDRIGSRVEFGERVAELVGKDSLDSAPGSFVHTELSAWLAGNPQKTPGKPIGVVTVAGEIVDGDAGPGTAGGERIAALLDEAADKDFAALVVRVDSPGGSIFASEEIRRAIDRYKARGVPVVVSMSNLAASGGYWVSTPARRIFAEPGTITGSIGVFAILPTFERALSDWGVTTDGVRTTPLSGQPDPIGGLAPEVSQMIQANVENSYARFLGLVAKSRGKTPEQVDAIGQGRVWDGGTARQLGLVDELGGLEEALAYAAKTAGLEDGTWHPVYLGEDADPFAGFLRQLAGGEGGEGRARDWAAIAADRQLAMLRGAIAQVDWLAGTRGVQAYCLECPRSPGGVPRGQATVRALAARMLGL